MQLALNNQRRFFNLVWIAIYYCFFSPKLFIKLVPAIEFFKIYFFFLNFSQKHVSWYATGLPAFHRYTLVVFKYRHGQASKRKTYIPTLPTMLFKRSKQADQKRKCAELWVRNNFFNVFLMYALGLVHEKFDIWIWAAPKSNWPTSHIELNSWSKPNKICRS